MAIRATLKNHGDESQLINRRLLLAGFFAFILLLSLMARLVVLQVMKHDHFDKLSANNHIDITAIGPQRGLIYDRNGILLADNVPTFSLELTAEKVENLDFTLQTLADLFALDDVELTAIRKEIKQQRSFRQVVVRQRLTEEEVAKFSVNRHRLPGVDVVARLLRHYPQGALFTHAVGYVGRINEKELTRIDVQAYKGTSHIGKTGIEKYYESTLHGEVGYQQVETNASGRVVRQLSREPATSGQDLFLHLDIKLQQAAANALTEAGFNGAIVAIEPRTGGVVAMVSQPDFDPNAFVSGIGYKAYGALRDSLDRPLFDRTLRGRYPPGSTLKPFVALAGLEGGLVNSRNKVFCPGWYKLPGKDHRYRCWKRHGHGKMDLLNALGQSCDVYFYDLAMTLGIDRLHGFLDLFNLGRKTGVDVSGESAGLSPSREWKQRSRNQVWFPGETLISGIGQGFNQTTPMQLAHATSVLAMRGEVRTPHVVRATRNAGEHNIVPLPIELGEHVPIVNIQNWENVISGMVEVMHGKRGTARRSAVDLPFEIAGKTGTAQVFNIKQNEKYDAATLAKKLHDHALFIAIAPADDPQLVVAVVVENGGGGSRVAAPMARKIIDAYFGFDEEEEEAEDEDEGVAATDDDVESEQQSAESSQQGASE